MKTAAMIFALALGSTGADPDLRAGRPSLGMASPYGAGSVRYRDSRGRTTFTTTTMNGVTRFYDSGGHLRARSLDRVAADGQVESPLVQGPSDPNG